MQLPTRVTTGLLAMALMPAAASDFKPLTQACEEALALSALPDDLRSQANVYVWRDGRFEQTIESEGTFHCVVERNHRDAIIPECVTDSGKNSILEGIVFKTAQAALGLSPTETTEKMTEQLESGKLPAPTSPGINYMMSAYNYIYIATADTIRTIPPHTMFFAPDAPESVVGHSFDQAVENPGSPFVTASGPHGYIITFTAQASDSSKVRQACNGQIDTGGWQAPPRALPRPR